MYLKLRRRSRHQHRDMGISVTEWRIRIGCFSSSRKLLRQCSNLQSKSVSVSVLFAYGVVILMLLAVAGIEPNPGPTKELKEIKAMLCEVKKTNEAIVSEVREINQTLGKLVSRIDRAENEIVGLKNEVTELRNSNWYLQRKLDDLENRSRRQNIIVNGLPQRGQYKNWDTTEAIVRELIQNSLKVKLEPDDIQRAHRIHSNNGIEPIVCCFLRDKKRSEVLQNARKLKGTEIYISEDYSYQVRSERRELKKHMIEARRQGRNAKLQFRHLIIDNRKYSLEDLEGDGRLSEMSSEV